MMTRRVVVVSGPAWRPPDLRLSGRKLGVSASFPNITNVESPQPGPFGFKPQGISEGIGLGLGGMALAYVSRYLPGFAEPVALIGGVGLLGFGIYRVYGGLTGTLEPSVEKFNVPSSQPKDALSVISGKILEPADKGKAELSSIWTAVFDTKRTFKVKFAVSNTAEGKDPRSVSLLVDLTTVQTSRPVVGDADVVQFSTSYVIDNLAPGDTKVIPGFQPATVLESLVQAQSYRSQDVVATLTARTYAADRGKKLDQISFTL